MSAKTSKSTSGRISGRSASTLVRVLESDKKFLVKLAAKYSRSMPEVLHGIIEEHKRQEFFDGLKAAYADLRLNKKAWTDELTQRRIYEGTLADGL